MPSFKYLIIGGGMTAHAAAAGIREVDADGTIGIISAESEIGDKQIDLFPFKDVHRSPDVFGNIGVVFVLEQTAQPIAGVLLVIDDQDGRLKRIHEIN